MAQLSRLTLGSAQLGGRYGIANDSGCPSDDEARAILAEARRGGIRSIDTARAYGTAEARLGRLIPDPEKRDWTIITKVAPLDGYMRAHGLDDVAGAACHSVQASLAALGTAHIPILMFHRADDIDHIDAVDAVRELAERGVVGELGVSVYTPEQAVRALARPFIRHLQVPFNLLDHRWLEAEFQSAVSQRPDVSVHVRSVFLQGLLLQPAARWPDWVGEAARCETMLEGMARQLEHGRSALCLRYVAAMPWVDTMVLGVETASQLRDLLEVPLDMALPDAFAAVIEELGALASPRLVNPALW